MHDVYDIAIIGAGPGGYVAAIRAGQLGMRVALIDERKEPGGTCLNVGCIPSKALLKSSYNYWNALHHFPKSGLHVEGLRADIPHMIDHKNTVVKDLTQGIHFLLKKNNVTYITGKAALFKRDEIPDEGTSFEGVKASSILIQVTGDNEKTWVEASKIIIATGSTPIEIPSLPFDGTHILSSTHALDLKHVPKHLVVVGGGYIGLEMGSVWNRLGAKVTVIEAMDDIVPMMDKDVRDGLRQSLTSQGITFHFSKKVTGFSKTDTGMHIHLSSMKDAITEESIVCDTVLVSVGRKPCTSGLRLEDIGVTLNNRGFIDVNDLYETTCPSVYAIGDVIGGMMLAHKAEEEGIALVESLAGQAGHVNYTIIPAIIFTHPEVATVGLTEEEAKAKGMEIRMGKFPFSANSLSRATGDTEGFVKIIADKKTDRVLGVHILGSHAGAMIAEATIAMEFHASSEDIARTCHAHPSHSEALKEAAWDTFNNRALHK